MKYLRRHSLRVVACGFLISALWVAAALCQNPAALSSPRPQPTGKLDTWLSAEMVVLPVTVTDKENRPVAGLPQEVFTVADEKTPEKIAFLQAVRCSIRAPKRG